MQRSRITILGSGGGVARAVLAVFNRAAGDPGDPLYPFLQAGPVYLVDLAHPPEGYYDRFTNLRGRIALRTFSSNDRTALTAHLAESGTGLLLDCSTGNLTGPLEGCAEQGVAYVNTALEYDQIADDPAFALFSGMARCQWFEAKRRALTGSRAIVCSGMNPGIVQWMALEVMRESLDTPLACYIVEDDTSFLADPQAVVPQTVYVTWSPREYLEEAVGNFPAYMRQHALLFRTDRSHGAEFYAVQLGPHRFAGTLVPHEEVFSLGRHFGFELGYIYKVNNQTMNLVRHYGSRPQMLLSLPRVLLDPDQVALMGIDRVGVLLVYPDREEYLYNAMSNEEAVREYGVGATYLQVACGVYAAACCLLLDSVPDGIHYVDDLLLAGGSHYGDYLRRHMRRFVRGTNSTSMGRLEERRLNPGVTGRRRAIAR
ncbi:MAG: hypothetical protein ACM3XM_09785 [Mycobacterium leprae]